MTGKCSYVFVCVCALLASVRSIEVPKVRTSEGVVIGQLVSDGNYIGYYGLHYGGATEGANRFKPPTPPPIYPGEYYAIDANIMCAQPSQRGLIGVENCLTLNVFTNNTETKKSVVVWLSGEEYTTTASNHVPSFKRFIQQNIVVVSLNYRLSVFGFLCLGVEQAPGNAGLKDVIQGLKWIKNNIAGFGGDPNNIVLLGHGSGAAMVDLITMSPQAKDLAHKAITLSGSALSPWAISYNPESAARNLGSSLGYTGKTNEKLASLLQTTDLSVLVSALGNFPVSYNNTPMFAPCIEDPKLNPNNTFLSDSPINILRSGNFHHIPYIAGYTNKEGTIRAEMASFYGWLLKMQENFTDFLPVDIDLNAAPNKTALEKSIKEFYFGNRAIEMDTIEDYLAYHGDTMILVSVINGAKERAKTSKANVRLFEFAYRGTFNSDWPYKQIPLTGVQHGGILNYLFDYDLKLNDFNIRSALMTRFATFIETSNPSGLMNIAAPWPAITNSSVNYLYYGGDDSTLASSVKNFIEENRFNPHEQRINFWSDIYSKYYKPPPKSAASMTAVSLVLTIVSMIAHYLV